MSAALEILQQYSQNAIAQLPVPAQQLVQNPIAQKVAGALLGLGVLRSLNNSLSQWTLNNWTSSKPWDNARELVLLTGGCSGIGKQVMEDLARKGVRVVILDICEPKFKLPATVSFHRVDITSSESIAEVAKKIRKEHGDPTILINNAGVGNEGTILAKDEVKIRQTFEVNIIAHFLTVREFLPAMIRANHGHIITVASMASFTGIAEISDYCCTKAGALAFHESLRQELRHYYKAPGVRTSIIHPFWVRTPMVQILIEWEKTFGQPIMSIQTVADAICKQVLSQNSGQIVIPGRLAIASLVRAMPNWLQERIHSKEAARFKAMREMQARAEAQAKA